MVSICAGTSFPEGLVTAAYAPRTHEYMARWSQTVVAGAVPWTTPRSVSMVLTARNSNWEPIVGASAHRAPNDLMGSAFARFLLHLHRSTWMDARMAAGHRRKEKGSHACCCVAPRTGGGDPTARRRGRVAADEGRRWIPAGRRARRVCGSPRPGPWHSRTGGEWTSGGT